MKLPQRLALAAAILFSQSTHAQWTNTGGPPSRVIKCFTVAGSYILAGTNGGLVGSTNNGASWAGTGGGLPYTDIRALLTVASYPFNVLAGMTSGKISMSTNYGSNWTGFPTDSVQAPPLAYINAIVKNNSEFWIGTERGIYLLPHYYPLSTWIPWHTGLVSGEFTMVRAMLERNGDIFAGANSGVYKLNGNTWIPKNIGLTNTNVGVLQSVGAYLIAGTSQGSTGGVYISTNDGENWTLSKTDTWVSSILIIGSTIFVGSNGDGVWRSTNYGSTWGQINDGFASSAYYVMSLGTDGQYIFAGTNNANVWRRPLSQVTSVGNETGLQPETFSLKQNYPNPFNPATTISFDVPQKSFVSLKVFDVLGHELATLVNSVQQPGMHTVQWDAAGFPSGVYFCRLQADSFDESRKLLLLR